MAKANKKSTKKEALSEDQIEALLKKGWNSLHKAFDDLIKGCETQQLDLVVDCLKLADKLTTIYEKAHMTAFYASKGARNSKGSDKDDK